MTTNDKAADLTAGPPDLGDCRFHYYGAKYCDRPAVEFLENNHALRFCAEHAAVYKAARR